MAGNGTTDLPDDSIAATLLGGSTYERLRLERALYFTQPTAVRLAWQSGLLLALTLVAPLAATLPTPIQAGALGGDPLAASPVIVIVATVALALQVGTAGALGVVAAIRVRAGESLSRTRAERLVTVEEVASLLGLGTGGLAVAVTDAYVLLGHAGGDAVAAYVAAGGRSPFAASDTGLSIAAVTLAAFVAAVVVFTASRYVNAAL
jgi:hypothetical protein